MKKSKFTEEQIAYALRQVEQPEDPAVTEAPQSASAGVSGEPAD